MIYKVSIITDKEPWKIENRCKKNWMNGEFLIIVATVAFGMGINKSQVDFVIHAQMPESYT
jgi:superfamily II DNA helicase RecQ